MVYELSTEITSKAVRIFHLRTIDYPHKLHYVDYSDLIRRGLVGQLVDHTWHKSVPSCAPQTNLLPIQMGFT